VPGVTRQSTALKRVAGFTQVNAEKGRCVRSGSYLKGWQRSLKFTPKRDGVFGQVRT